MLLQQLKTRELISPPSFLLTNTQYLTIMGSQAYAIADTNDKEQPSDFDVYGFCIPPLELIFDHINGNIPGFGKQIQRFEQWQQYHIYDKTACASKGREYDLTVFSIVKYFQLLMDNNPNIIDSLFTPTTCVLHTTQVGELIRENKRIFLHKGCWHKFRGYAFSQMHKMNTKETEGKRREIRDKFGYDVKYAVHLVRLLYECEQILTEGDLDLRRNNEHLKAIRRGEVKEEEIREWFTIKEKELEKVYGDSKLPWGPDEDKIKALLVKCLEMHYGSLEKWGVRVNNDKYVNAVKEISEVLDKYNLR